MKKISILVTGGIVILLISAIKYPVFAAACPLIKNRPYKTLISNAVYFITPNCTKKVFESADVYFSYFDSWKEIKKTTLSQLEKIPLDTDEAMPCFLETGKPYKSKLSRAVFFITESCRKQHFESAEVFFQYFDSWKNVRLVPAKQLGRIKYAANKIVEIKNHTLAGAYEPPVVIPAVVTNLPETVVFSPPVPAEPPTPANLSAGSGGGAATETTPSNTPSPITGAPEVPEAIETTTPVLTQNQEVVSTTAEQLPEPISDPNVNEVWVTGISEKILPGATKRSLEEISLYGAKNEFVSFQVAVPGPVSLVSVTAKGLSSGANIISSSHIKLYREELINLTKKSGNDGFTGRVPDALVPDVDDVIGQKRNAFPFNVPSGETRAVWVEIYIPESTAAGSYTGSLTVQSSKGSTVVPFKLKVWNFSLPSTSSIRNYFGLSYNVIPAGHKVGYGPELTRLRTLYTQMALDHRMSLSYFDDGNESPSYIQNVYGKFINGTASTTLKGAKITSIKALGDKSAFAAKAKEMGWFAKVFDYTCDEPPTLCSFSVITPRNDALKAIDPEFRNLVTTNIKDATQYNVAKSIDLMVPPINWMHDKGGMKFAGNQRNTYDAFLATRSINELWLYQSCMSHGCDGSTIPYSSGWTSYMIDKAPLRARSMAWLLFKYRVKGELYYESGYAFTQGDPWTNQYYFGGNGDGTLFYPGLTSKIGGANAIPIASIRLKLIRAGYQDYEYLNLFEKLGGGAEARNIIDKMFPNPWTQPTITTFEEARISLGNAIEQK